MDTAAQHRSAQPDRGGFGDRLIAEALRLHEDRDGRVLDEANAWQAGRRAGDTLEGRILARARASSLGQQVMTSLASLRRLAVWGMILALALSLGLGMLAAGAALDAGNQFETGSSAGTTSDGRINMLWVLGSLLGVQTLMLLLWLVLSLVWRRADGGGALGWGLMNLMATLGRRLGRSRAFGLALAALLHMLGQQGLGRWSASTLTHALWAACGLGMIITCVWRLSVQQYDFVWGTTLLDEGHYLSLIAALSALPGLLGVPVPDESIILSSRLGASEGAQGRMAWSGLLVASLLLYGFLPRLLLALGCATLALRSRSRWRLDLGLPGYARLAPRLLPDHAPLGVVDPSQPVPDLPPPSTPPRAPTGSGRLAVLGLELEHPGDHWSQHQRHAGWICLGQVEDRQSRMDVFAALEALFPPPAAVVVLASWARTPDRSTEHFLSSLRTRTDAPVWLLLDQGGLARQRAVDIGARHTAWRELAWRAGVDLLLPETPDARDHANADILLDSLARLRGES